MGMGSFGYFRVTVIRRTFSLGFSFRFHFRFGIDIASAINGNNIYIPDIPFADRAFSDIGNGDRSIDKDMANRTSARRP
jgi:hypothetical protein